MHRTTGDGYDVDDGRRINLDDATVDKAMDQNAIQEEICNVITHAGLTIRGDGHPITGDPAIEDWNATPDQMKQAIFESGAIGNDAITDNTLLITKLSLPATRVNGDDQLYFDIEQLKFTNDDLASLSKDGLYAYNSGSGCQIYLTGIGIQYNGGPGNSSYFDAAVLRKSAFDISQAISWNEIGSSDAYLAEINYDTDIPSGTLFTNQGVTAAWVQFGDVTDNYVCPATIKYYAVGGYIRVTKIMVHSLDSSPGNTFRLIIEYNASGL